MTKVLLINSNRFRHPWPVIPFGLCYIATMLETRANNKVLFLDLCFSDDCSKDIKNALDSFQPDVIGISIRNIDDTGGYKVHFLLEDVKNDVIVPCKKEFAGPIVIGGPSVGISGKEMLGYFDLEYGIAGDGEIAMTEFINRLERRQPLEGLEGLIIRRNDTIIEENGINRVWDLNSLPFPQLQRYVNLDQYRRYGSPVLVQTKRGCTFTCAYCTYNQIEGNYYRLKSPSLIAKEIEELVTETGINHVEFVDSIFNVPLAHAKEVLKNLIQKNMNLKLHTMGLSPAAIDEELLDLMKTAGFNEVDIGAESLCDTTLKSLSKDFNKEDIIKTSALLKKKRLPATWFLLLGAPAESTGTLFETLDSASKIISPWDLIFVSTGVRVYNGSPIARRISNVKDFCAGDNFLKPVKIEPQQVNLEEVYRIVKRYSFFAPNLYFYEKEHITPGWLIITANVILRIFKSRQPVWKLLILIKKIELYSGISLIKRSLYLLKLKLSGKRNFSTNGFSLIHAILK